MQKLVVLPEPRMAQAFVDYCDSQAIPLKLAPELEGVAVWLADNALLPEAEQELERFLQDPHNPRYLAASWEMAESRTSRFHYGGPSLSALIKQGAGPVTLSIMAVCIGVFAVWASGWQRPLLGLMHFPASSAQSIEVWRWFSHALLHFSVMHIAFNLLWWWLLGGQIERALGSGKLIMIFLVSALISGAGQFWTSGVYFGGLSGVVYALLGYCWLLGRFSPERGVSVPQSYVMMMMGWLVLGYLQPFFSIANDAHLFGLLSGCLMALLDSRFTRSKTT
uniref:rhomboid family intramembrane serine protease GlpG n=1 Tax=Thaumasiovibrio occultus TaxID=1891184 RepID=UPI000B3604EC|nr:rhomboid family intramembrane serine protease GlpG [Thaumasiovibrio occultus]